jgi:glycosyltransferase involved in cell wall biosynthesis
VLRHLAALGHVIDIVLARHQRHPQGVDNWVIHRLPIGRGLRWPVAMLVMPPAIRRLYDATRFDLLRAHSLRFIGPAALIARRRYRLDVPIVAHHHHLDPSALNPLIEGRVMRAVDRVVVGSQFAVRQAGASLGVPAEQFSVVPYGVDRRFERRERPAGLAARLGLGAGPVVLYLGGLKPRKNLSGMLAIWREVVRERPAARLVVAGSGPLRGSLEREAARLDLSRSVVFTGFVPEAEKVDQYNLADVLLFPSSMEGFGLSVAEAMSCAIPVVTSDRGSLPELVVDGEGGFVCDPARSASFTRALLTLLDDPLLRRKFGAANRERIDERFRWDHCAARTARVYEEVLDGWRRRRAAAR